MVYWKFFFLLFPGDREAYKKNWCKNLQNLIPGVEV
jgi:hypothetical protein